MQNIYELKKYQPSCVMHIWHTSITLFSYNKIKNVVQYNTFLWIWWQSQFVASWQHHYFVISNLVTGLHLNLLETPLSSHDISLLGAGNESSSCYLIWVSNFISQLMTYISFFINPTLWMECRLDLDKSCICHIILCPWRITLHLKLTSWKKGCISWRIPQQICPFTSDKTRDIFKMISRKW